jgi:hypothetical protein
MGTGGAGRDGKGVVEASILGGEEAYFWEDIVCSGGGCPAEGSWSMTFVGVVYNAETGGRGSGWREG